MALVLLCLLTVQQVQAALVCSPATPTSGSFSGVVNDYWSGSGSPAVGASTLSLGSRRTGGAGNSINAGDLVLIIQMQDADINSTNSSAYGSGGATGAGSTAVNSSGLYEYVVATNSVGAGGGALTFSPALSNSYRTRAYSAGSNGQSSWQAIRIPSFSSATASNVTTPAWDGTTGGVVALDVENTLTLNGTTAINVAGLGFRGGAGRSLGGSGSGANTDYRTLASNAANGSKAEGIAGRARYLNNATGYNTAPVLQDTGTEGYPNGSYARGAPGNAGGGGTDGNRAANDQNTGGGGGGNYGAGGRGGNSWSSNLAVGGIGGGGYGGTLAFNRVFMGGGGGAGTTNNATGDTATYTAPPGLSCSGGALCSSGAAGGGIVIVRAGSLGGSGLIDARGADAYNVQNDGAGGGGAGGSVVLQTYSGGSASVNASGGNGGNAWRGSTTNPHGPGGGGGGGFIAYSPATGLSLLPNFASGLSGLTTTANLAFGATSSTGGLAAFNAPNVPGAPDGAFCPPAIKAVRLFNDGGTAGSVDRGDTLEYTVIYRNGSGSSITGFNISDALPASLTYVPGSLAITPSGGASGSASGGYNGTAGNTSLLAANVTLPAGGIIQARLRATVANNAAACGNQTNQASSVQSGGEMIGLTDNADNSQNSNGLPSASYISQAPFGTSGASDATGINVLCQDVSIGKTFAPATVNSNGASTLTLTLTNFTAAALTGAALTDTYPAGMLNSATPALTNACGGTATAAAGSNTIALSGGTIPANGSCTLTVSVTGTATATNTIPVGGVTANGGVNNALAASATLTVNQPPTVAKSFSPSSIPTGASSTLTITLTNPNAAAATGAALTDTYPAGLINAATPAVATTCGGTATAIAGGSTVALSGGTIPAGGSCTVTVSVTSNSAASLVNTIPVGGLTTANMGSNQVAANATLAVLLPLTVEKSFSPSSVARSNNDLANQSVMTITLSNPNSIALTGVAFTDPYPQRTTGGSEYLMNLDANLTDTGEGNSCGGTPTATTGNGTSSLALAGASLPAGGSCSVSIRVFADGSGSYINTIAAGSVTSAQGASNTVAASATFSANRLGITKTFSSNAISTNSISTLTLVLSNPTKNNRNNIGVVDTYPTGLVNATPLTTSNTCGGTLAATAGGGSVTLSGVTLNSGLTCTVSIQVTSSTAGVYTNTTEPITSSGNAGGAIASDVLTVTSLSPSLTFLKSVVVTSDPVNGTSNPKFIPGADALYSLLVTNSGAGPVDGNSIAISDPIPANTQLFVGDLGSPGSGPIVFANGTPTGGLTYTFTSLASTTDDVEFYNAANTLMTPVSVGGYDANVARIVIKPKGAMAANTGSGSPNFSVSFRVQVK